METSPVAAVTVPLTIARERLIALPVRRYAGPVCLVKTAADLDRARRDVLHEHVIGFDTETQPTFRKGQSHRPSLVQLATHRAVYLFQVQQVDCAPLLADVLGAATLLKAGIGLNDDLIGLKKLIPFTERNVLDLGAVARQHGVQQSGIRNLAGLFFGFRITKGPRTSNWARPHLTASQITYAATDAWVCRELYLEFKKRKFCA